MTRDEAKALYVAAPFGSVLSWLDCPDGVCGSDLACPDRADGDSEGVYDCDWWVCGEGHHGHVSVDGEGDVRAYLADDEEDEEDESTEGTR